ncbi:hypothetical protein [Dactylosporangium sp. CA-092794]|uniref:hypothetical protein n=1 Tax=Dactylosporangium sp. CA-092794 TaxID=3239929 RepID=UPI003D90F366
MTAPRTWSRNRPIAVAFTDVERKLPAVVRAGDAATRSNGIASTLTAAPPAWPGR